MPQSKNKPEFRLQKLIGTANQMKIEVRTERLLRDIGYRVRSGRCRFKGKEIILIDRDTPISEQIEILASELGESPGESQ